ncbi:MAG: AraC family transcriptional activator of pobA [Crocinitomix sp.]|jgi:AraC family transcriptional activator of pobA
MFLAKEIKSEFIKLMPDQQEDYLYIIWNKDSLVEINVDGNIFTVKKNCIIFISEFHMEVSADFKKARIIQFDKSFLGIDNSLNQAGDYLLVFYGYHFLDNVPKIELTEKEGHEFDQIWENILLELPQIEDSVSQRLIRNSFQRLMLLSQRFHAVTEFDLPIDYMNLRLIREFQYLVETNFKSLTKVSDYAQILKVPAKKISELFNLHYRKKPSDLIAHRRNLFAKKQLLHTKELIKNIAYDLNFSDSQTFSHFFKRINGVTPDEFRM